ncbi:terminase small subunit [Acidovorax temperans]|uniref:terminase small subunit n=1 Tax=Acidovorax temperans TaxID=80878 RepID=UPI000AC370BF|nr:terminase small subunit [Acidovorax temperans]
MAAPGKVVDWAGVERAYCGSRQSTREIGKAFGISHTMVAKHAAAQGWVRPPKEEKAKPSPKPSARPAPAPIKAPAPFVAPGLDSRQQRFVDEYLVDLNGTQAAIRAGYSAKTAAEQSYDLLRRPQIAAAIAAGRAAQQERTQINADALLLQAWQIAFADPRELVETRVGCCRHCWGENFKRQRTVGQRNADFEKWCKEGKPAAEFDEEGGIGFNPHLPPHPDCTECCGVGVSRDVIKDTRYLSPAAAQLYAGVKRTKDGLQVLMHDKAAFAEKLFKHLGLYEKDNGQKNDPLALRNLTDAERAVRMSAVLQANPGLAVLFGQLMSGGAQQ